VKEKCLKMLSEYHKWRCRCHVGWKTVAQVGDKVAQLCCMSDMGLSCYMLTNDVCPLCL